MSGPMRIGTVFPNTGSVYIGDDTFVPEWVIRGAPYFYVQNPHTKNWQIRNQFGDISDYDESKDYAEKEVERRNLLAATAIMLTEGKR